MAGFLGHGPFLPPRSWRSGAGDIARPGSLDDTARELGRRGFTVLLHDDNEVRAWRSRFHAELLTGIDAIVWLRRVGVVDVDTIEHDEVRFAAWAARAVPVRRLRSRMTVLGYLADRSSPEARARVLRGPRMGSGRFHGTGIRDADGVHAFRGVRVIGWAFFPLMNFLVHTTLAPRPDEEPRVPWVWSVILALGMLPVALALGTIAVSLLRAHGLP